MSPVQLCYWLQGFFEIGGDSIKTLNEKQLQIIKNHLNLVFVHSIDPEAGGPEVQTKLNAIHNEGKTQDLSAFLDNLPPLPSKPSITYPETPAHLKAEGVLYRC